MRRRTFAIVSIALIVALATPVVALAGNGRASAPGQLKKMTAPGESQESMAANGKGAALGKPEWAGAGDGDGVPNADGTGRKAMRAHDESGSPDATGSVDGTGPAGPSARGRERGISNAAARIQANLDRAEARVVEGTQSHVPEGLLRVLQKFLSWLGIAPAVTTPPDGGTDGGSTDETVTPTP